MNFLSIHLTFSNNIYKKLNGKEIEDQITEKLFHNLFFKK